MFCSSCSCNAAGNIFMFFIFWKRSCLTVFVIRLIGWLMDCDGSLWSSINRQCWNYHPMDHNDIKNYLFEDELKVFLVSMAKMVIPYKCNTMNLNCIWKVYSNTMPCFHWVLKKMYTWRPYIVFNQFNGIIYAICFFFHFVKVKLQWYSGGVLDSNFADEWAKINWHFLPLVDQDYFVMPQG